jgi:hypothetical protein
MGSGTIRTRFGMYPSDSRCDSPTACYALCTITTATYPERTQSGYPGDWWSCAVTMPRSVRARACSGDIGSSHSFVFHRLLRGSKMVQLQRSCCVKELFCLRLFWPLVGKQYPGKYWFYTQLSHLIRQAKIHKIELLLPSQQAYENSFEIAA